MNNPDEKDKTHLESKLDTLKSLRIKLSDIRNEYYEVVADDSDLEPFIRKQERIEKVNLASKELPRWEDFMNFLLKRCLILENIQTNDATAIPSERSYKTKSFLAKLDPASCVICEQQPHPVFRFSALLIKWFYAKVRQIVQIVLYKRHNSLLCRNFERNVDSQRSSGSETLPNMEPRITPTLNVKSECFQPKQTIPSCVESFENGGEFVGHSKGHSTSISPEQSRRSLSSACPTGFRESK
ncbi:hypothetical protein TNCV_505081 [Trichonephila clavipes]|nr:hypothetical protein TNCV_505081 [Trichonephila clavipes]